MVPPRRSAGPAATLYARRVRDRDTITRPLAGVFDLIARFKHEIHELGKFGVVGAFAWVVDTGVFKACLDANANQYLAAVISTLVSATFAFLGNRFWTWRDRRGASLHREYVLYAFFNAIGLLIAIGCLLVNDKILGAIWPSIFHTQLASIIAKNGLGLVLGTAFRFWSYKRFVFPKHVHPAIPEADVTALVGDEPEQAPARAAHRPAANGGGETGPVKLGPLAAAPEHAPVIDHGPNGSNGSNGSNGGRPVRPEPIVLDEGVLDD